MAGTKYEPVRGADSSDEGLSSSEAIGIQSQIFPRFPKDKIILIITLFVSVVGHVIWIWNLHISTANQNGWSCVSEYAHLSRDTLKPFAIPGKDDDIPDEEWEFPMADTGVIALTDAFVAEKGLPSAQRWPWDSSRGIYLLQGHHNLHCLKKLRTSILQFRNQTEQTEPVPHVDHCLIALREDILCNADDSPRYSSEEAGRGTAFGQYRLCRDWTRLDEWANKHSACYIEPDTYEDGVGEVERYRRCPDGSNPSLENGQRIT
ncbi:hypothetical protein EAF04_009122 [Stromatinia cepivora]|nr:hypothetical protein EAF04_009122 [Stromatinia cepivora]